MDRYKTLSQAAVAEFTERRSRFLSSVSPVSSEKEAIDFLESVKKQHREAKHNVYAYRVREGNKQRYSDDGEPQGTAGVPVLDVLLKEDLTDCIAVVTRYFGGILLGAGGLVRAYSASAKLGINAGVPVFMEECVVAQIVCDYSFYASLTLLIEKFSGTIEDTGFTERVILQLFMPKNRYTPFCDALTEQSGGQITPEILSKTYKGVK